MAAKISLRTPSKINLFLRIAGKRDDGYHNLETIFLPLKDIYDVIEIDINDCDGIRIFSSSKDIPCNNSNLCHKAAERYLAKASIKTGLNIHIEKNIPVTAGMGGGSSDAAAVLLILQDYFKALSEKDLAKIALTIGADIPFFLNPSPSAGYGVGDVLNHIEIKQNFTVVISAPQFPVSAAWAYKNMVKPCVCEKLQIDALINLLSQEDFKSIIPFVKNDLAQALYNKFPLLGSIRKDMIAYGLDAVEITGSGPTVFGICKDDEVADEVLVKMKAKYNSTLLLTQSKILFTPNQIVHG
ncbi:MAG: 4-(cytidine 5'-diphospho)-2-C-methyl-D-erythritol kinase [Lentisphaerota bacterium]